MTKIEVYKPAVLVSFYFEKIEIKMSDELWRFLRHYLRMEGFSLEEFAHRAELHWFLLWEQERFPIDRNTYFVDYVRRCLTDYRYKARNVSNDWRRTGDQPTYSQYGATRQDFAGRWFLWTSHSKKQHRRWSAAVPKILSGVSAVRLVAFDGMDEFLRRHDQKWLVVPVGPFFVKLQV